MRRRKRSLTIKGPEVVFLESCMCCGNSSPALLASYGESGHELGRRPGASIRRTQRYLQVIQTLCTSNVALFRSNLAHATIKPACGNLAARNNAHINQAF